MILVINLVDISNTSTPQCVFKVYILPSIGVTKLSIFVGRMKGWLWFGFFGGSLFSLHGDVTMSGVPPPLQVTSLVMII